LVLADLRIDQQDQPRLYYERRAVANEEEAEPWHCARPSSQPQAQLFVRFEEDPEVKRFDNRATGGLVRSSPSLSYGSRIR
jgi:hypothetical protein